MQIYDWTTLYLNKICPLKLTALGRGDCSMSLTPCTCVVPNIHNRLAKKKKQSKLFFQNKPFDKPYDKWYIVDAYPCCNWGRRKYEQ